MFLATAAMIWSIAAITPGPNFLAVTRCSLAGDRQVALASVAGTILGTSIWGLAGWLGISALFNAAPAMYLALKVLGGGYIIWIGLRLLRDSWCSSPVVMSSHGAARLSKQSAFRLGLATNLANPKSAIFVASVFAAALPKDYHWAQGLACVGIMVAISSAWYSVIAVSLSSARVARAYLSVKRILDVVTGAVFVAFGVKLMLADR